MAYWIRRLRPDVVLGHDPWKRYRLHPDHRHAGHLAVEGIVAARDPLFFPEQQLEPHRPGRCCCSRPTSPTTWRPSSGFAEAKLAALFAHESQFRSTMAIEAGDGGAQRQAFVERITGRLAEHGALAGVAPARPSRRSASSEPGGGRGGPSGDRGGRPA